MIANTLVSVNLSAIPNDLVNLHRAARSACMAVLDLAPGFSGRSKESLWNKEKIPAEIFSRIVQFAMTADESRFEFSDKVGEFRPNVATGLLTVR